MLGLSLERIECGAIPNGEVVSGFAFHSDAGPMPLQHLIDLCDVAAYGAGGDAELPCELIGRGVLG